LSPELGGFVAVPICPHTLHNRPLVFSPQEELEVMVSCHGGGTPMGATIDGHESIPLREGARVRVRRAPVEFQLIQHPGRGRYDTLREKLRWGASE